MFMRVLAHGAGLVATASLSWWLAHSLGAPPAAPPAEVEVLVKRRPAHVAAAKADAAAGPPTTTGKGGMLVLPLPRRDLSELEEKAVTDPRARLLKEVVTEGIDARVFSGRPCGPLQVEDDVNSVYKFSYSVRSTKRSATVRLTSVSLEEGVEIAPGAAECFAEKVSSSFEVIPPAREGAGEFPAAAFDGAYRFMYCGSARCARPQQTLPSFEDDLASASPR
jgi:hypothetical protein